MTRKRTAATHRRHGRSNGIPITRLGAPRPFWTRPAWIRRGTRMAAPATMLAGLALLALPVPDWRTYGGLGGLLSVRNISMWLALLLPATALAVSAVPRRGRVALTAAGTAAWLVCLASTAMSLSVCVPGSGACVDYPAGGYGQTRRLCLLALAAGLDAAAMLGLYRQTLIRKKEKEMKRQEDEKTTGPDRGVVAVMAGMMLMAVPLLTAGKITIPRICLCLMTLLPAMALGLAGLGTPVRRTMRVALTAGGAAGLLVVMATDYDLIPTAWAESSWWALDYGVGYSTGAQLVLVLLSLAAILANALLVAADTMRERYQAPSKAAGHQHVEAAPRRGRHTAGDER